MAETLTVEINVSARNSIDRLKKAFGVATDVEVLSRALALANTAAEIAGTEKIVHLTGAAPEKHLAITLNG